MTIPEEIEQLKIKLSQADNDNARANLLLEILQKYQSMKSKDGQPYLESLNQLADKLNNDEHKAWARYYNGQFIWFSGNYDSANSEAERALALFTALKHAKGLSSCYNFIGLIYDSKGSYKEAIDSYSTAAKICEENGDKLGAARAHGNIGTSYLHQGNYLLALSNYTDVLEIFKELGNKTGQAHNYNNLGIVYYLQGNYSESLSNGLMGLKLWEELGDKMGMANSFNNIGTVYEIQVNYPEALSNYKAALKIRLEIEDKRGISTSYSNIGITYRNEGDYPKALANMLAALKICKELGDKKGIVASYNDLGSVYVKKGDYAEALSNYLLSLQISEENGYKDTFAIAAIGAGISHSGLNAHSQAAHYLTIGLATSKDIGSKDATKDALEAWYKLKKAEGDGTAALAYHEQFVQTEKEVQNEETAKKIAGLQFGYQMEKKEQEVNFERREKEELQVAYKLLDKEKQRSEELLLNILPAEVAEELKAKGTAEAKLFDNVTVLFTDFKDFTKVSERLSPQQLVDELHACFSAFDEVIARHNIEKIKTVGDAYLAVSGLPNANTNHAVDIVNACIEIRDFIQKRRKERGDKTFEIRIGAHSGSVVAGIVGVKKFAYDIWGDTVNTAARMEQNSAAGKINISQNTYELVKDRFALEYRGEIEAKNKGKLKMYFVN